MKICSKCKIEKPFSQFNKHLGHRDRLASQCKDCQHISQKLYRQKIKDTPQYQKELARHRTWYYNDIDKHREQNRLRQTSLPYQLKRKDYALRKLYGITLEEKHAMWLQQNKQCLICEVKLRDSKEANVDHDHKTGKVRGILCRRCNSVLGYICESEKILHNIFFYLKLPLDKEKVIS